MKSGLKISIMEKLLKNSLVLGALILSAHSFGQKQEKKADLPVCPVKREVSSEGQLTRVLTPSKKSEPVMKMAKLQSTMPERRSNGIR